MPSLLATGRLRRKSLGIGQRSSHERLNLLLYAGAMSASLKQDLLDAVTSVPGIDAASHTNRAKVALFLALASPEYLVQR